MKKDKAGSLRTDQIGLMNVAGYRDLRPNRHDADASRGPLKYVRNMQFVQSFTDSKTAAASGSFVANSPKKKVKGRDTADAPLVYPYKP